MMDLLVFVIIFDQKNTYFINVAVYRGVVKE